MHYLITDLLLPFSLYFIQYLLNLTHEIAFLWPTKSLVVLQVERSMICAVGPPPFIACADTNMLPSGDQPDHNNMKLDDRHRENISHLLANFGWVDFSYCSTEHRPS